MFNMRHLARAAMMMARRGETAALLREVSGTDILE
jgi:hypothetical protein